MKLRDFKVGEEFWCADRRWRCTDIGSRVIVAILVDQVKRLTRAQADAEGWFNGPSYAVAEHVFDEDDQEACTAAF